MIPETLEGWTLDVVREVAAKGIVENDAFDLKVDLQPAEHQRKSTAAFANTRGGFLVFGVTNDRQVVGVENKELVRDFGSKLAKGLEPSIDFRFAVPLAIGPERRVFICHIPRSPRGPHAVLLNDAWVFYKRTASGSNVAATFDEIRSAFLDTGRRHSELAWLRADVQRIRDLAYRINVESSLGSFALDLLLARLDAIQLRTLLVSVFSYIGSSSFLVTGLHELVERCGKVDAVLESMAEFAMRPRDRSYLRTEGDGRDVVRDHVPAIVMLAERLLQELDKVLK